MQSDELVFVGIKGSAMALNRADGTIVWQNHLAGSGFVNLVLEGDNLYATAQGEVFCLDPVTGRYRWHNALRGYGWGIASIVVRNGTDCGKTAVAAAEEQVEAEQQAHLTQTAATTS